MSQDIRASIRDFVLKYVKDDELGDDENMFELGYVNSLFAMQLVMFVEKEFQLTISRENLKLSNFQSIDAIVALVEGEGHDR
ncbi:MAG: acyl carrier protein [Deltaproteobacteria bacterium]|nr:acyl carrier protein [Deltaproteobacteria bacterium]